MLIRDQVWINIDAFDPKSSSRCSPWFVFELCASVINFLAKNGSAQNSVF